MRGSVADERAWQLLNLLADGEFHSGEILAGQLGVSRASVCNSLTRITDSGVALHKVRGRGYRLAHPWLRLEKNEVLRLLGKEAGQFHLEILQQAASSNTLLLQRAGLDAPGGSAPTGTVLAVEMQTAGRGRLGRNWHASLGAALTFSLLWRFDRGLHALSGLSLGVGVAVLRALKKLGAGDIFLKWPNDILTAQGKLAGVLIEAQGDMLGPSAVVIGIGLNCGMPTNLAQQIDQPVSALDEVCATLPSRNQLLAAVMLELAQVLRQFSQEGFAGLRDEWEQNHIHQDRPVRIRLADGRLIQGIARGVSDDGELCLETAQGMQRMNSGDVSGVRQ